MLGKRGAAPALHESGMSPKSANAVSTHMVLKDTKSAICILEVSPKRSIFLTAEGTLQNARWLVGDRQPCVCALSRQPGRSGRRATAADLSLVAVGDTILSAARDEPKTFLYSAIRREKYRQFAPYVEYFALKMHMILFSIVENGTY